MRKTSALARPISASKEGLLTLDMGSPGSVTALNRPCGMSARANLRYGEGVFCGLIFACGRKSNSGDAANRRKGAIGVMRCVHFVTLLSEATKCLTGPEARLYNDAAKRALKLRHLQAELTLGSAYGFLPLCPIACSWLLARNSFGLGGRRWSWARDGWW